MRDMVLRFTWFFFVTSLISYSIFLMMGRFISAQVIDQSRVVTVRDKLRPGVHELYGMVMVPRTCAELAVSTQIVSSSTYALHFTTWNEPSVPCKTDDTPRAFNATVFAPAAGVEFVGSLDDTPLHIVVYQQIADQ